MGAGVYGDDDWILEYFLESGSDSVSVNLPEAHDSTLDVPAAFAETVDASYYRTMTDTVERLTDDGKTVLIDRDGTVEPVDPDAMDGYTPDTWGEDRPRLLAVDAGVEPDQTDAEPVLWDGDTMVPVFSEEDRMLTIDLVSGSYAERSAVPDHVDRFPVEQLPASLNSTLLPIVEHDGEEGVVLFERGPGTGEYPDRYVTIAGGAPSLMDPADVAWLEAREEARLLPDYSPDRLREHGLVPDDAKIAEGTVGDIPAYILEEDDGVGMYFQTPADAMDFLGIVRDVDGTYAPEAVYTVDTGLPFGGENSDGLGIADNYTVGEEHVDIAFVPLDEMQDAHDYVPTTSAAVALLDIHRGEADLDTYQRTAPEHYPDAETTVL